MRVDGKKVKKTSKNFGGSEKVPTFAFPFETSTSNAVSERVSFIDNTERKDQRGKEKQKEKSVLI